MITCIITMAGKGSRFVPVYGDIPKFLIKVKGQTLFHHSLSSLPLDIIDHFIFVCRKCDQSVALEEMISHGIKQKFDIVYLDEVLPGQALSAKAAIHLLDLKSELIIYNIDTKFTSSSLSRNLISNNDDSSFIGAFIDETATSHWSFAKVENNIVTETAEKVKISNFALSGLYHFKSALSFLDGVDWLISNQIMLNSEFYIAPIYNKLIAEGLTVRLDMVSEIFPLGTPQDLSLFEKNII
ncbi:sugar phosphate nucleotidyltransferase [Gammaproteobacteria bacterium]|nr:sugar phosphate nucleotidyltransferase [Gammaproteobacteria bacterium]